MLIAQTQVPAPAGGGGFGTSNNAANKAEQDDLYNRSVNEMLSKDKDTQLNATGGGSLGTGNNAANKAEQDDLYNRSVNEMLKNR
ncbi:MAG: hypothetical protein HWD61_02925 [Parachlamydiaceae bacterium]|nr:MAG: hypothetical protein HWD61_02925 [Parachlamydiaceae bacterium]